MKRFVITRGATFMAVALLPLGITAASAHAATGARTAMSHHAGSGAKPWIHNPWGRPGNQRLSARITADYSHLRRMGIQLSRWGPASVSGKIAIFLVHYSPGAARALRALYGNAVLVSRISMPLMTAQARGSDTPPYDGGDFLWLPSTGGYCSGGPIVTNSSGNLRMLTAGHCVSAVGNFVYRSDASGETNGPHMGNVVDRDRCSGCLDTAVVDNNSAGSSYQERVWGLNYNTSNEPQYNEVGTAFPNPANCSGGVPGCSGDLVTQDSAVTGEITGIPVVAVSQTMPVSGISTRALSIACTNFHFDNSSGSYVCNSSGGKAIGDSGDSGGPWIVHGSGQNVTVAGTDEGGGFCDANGFNCTEEAYEQIFDIDSKYSLTIP
jgi:hypothetical protein